jgi:trimeric autotransporter adhesin
VRVAGIEGATNYTLNLTGTPGLGLAPEPNNTLATAYNLGTLNTLRQFNGFVGWSDPDDYYRFTLGTSRQVDLMLGGMSAFADLQLLDRNGVVVASDSAHSDHTTLAISRSLAAGEYIVRVKHYEDPDYFPVNKDTRYRLSLAA